MEQRPVLTVMSRVVRAWKARLLVTTNDMSGKQVFEKNMSRFAAVGEHVSNVRSHLQLLVRCAKDSSLYTWEEYADHYGQWRGFWEWNEHSMVLLPAEIHVVSEEGTIWRKDGHELLADFARDEAGVQLSGQIETQKPSEDCSATGVSGNFSMKKM